MTMNVISKVIQPVIAPVIQELSAEMNPAMLDVEEVTVPAPSLRWSPTLSTVRSTTLLADETANGNDGVLSNMTPATDWVDEGGGLWALDFDGSNDFIFVAADSAYNAANGDLTVSIHFKPTDVSGAQFIFLTGSSVSASATNGYGFYLIGSTLKFYHEHTSNAAITVDFPDAVVAGTWIHACVVRDLSEKTFSVYQNGSLVLTESYLTNPDGGTSAFLIGGAGVSVASPFEGRLDDMIIWKGTALTAAQVAKLATRGAAVSS